MPIGPAKVETWKSLIARDELQECLDEIMDASRELPPSLSHQVIGLNARLHNVGRQDRLGTLSRDEKMRETARVRVALLELLPQLTSTGGVYPETVKTIQKEAGPVPVYLSWSCTEDDKPFKRDLEKQLTLLRRMGKISVWDKTMLPAGSDIVPASALEREKASLFLLLLSQDYFFSDECFEELEQIQLMRSNFGASIVPLLIRPCQYELLPIGRLQVLPRNKMPVSEHPEPDSAWASIVREILALLPTT